MLFGGCEYCGRSTHLPGCPNEPAPAVFAECEACGMEIYDGDEYYEIDGFNYCESCVQGGYRTAEVE